MKVKAQKTPVLKQKCFGLKKIITVESRALQAPECIRGYTVSPPSISNHDALDDNLVKRWDKGAILNEGRLVITFIEM